MKNSKTTIGGLIMAIGGALSGTGFLTILSQSMPGDIKIPASIIGAAWWVSFAGVILGIVGKTWTAFFAADASTVSNIAATVDAINQQGSSPSAPPATQSKP